MKNAVIVLGYNNTRINDVKKIKEKAARYLNAITVLCKKDPTESDKEAVDNVINTGLEANDINVNATLNGIKELSINVIAVLPFSDPGTQLAGALATQFPNLVLPDPTKIKAALDKYTFRDFEKINQSTPARYKKINSKLISSFEELTQAYAQFQGKAFLKPAKEGNSRGCINLTKQPDLKKAWEQLEKYTTAGVVIEELVSGGSEYSWDHVNGYSWITEKKTSNNEYSTEFQHIVPATLNDHSEKIISDAGKFMADLSGYNGGACHNELFYFPNTDNVYGVEPNLRPAGGRIWDLASLAFENFDPWKEWLLWAAGKNHQDSKSLNRQYYAGIRKLKADKNGIINTLPLSMKIEEFNTPNIEYIELIWTKKIGDHVTNIPKDNSEYLGYIIARSKNYRDLENNLEKSAVLLQEKILISETNHAN